jgi:hypothetical protein
MPETPTDRWSIVVSALILTIAVLSPASAGPNDSMPASADDYLSPELRGRVEQLKLDVAREATTAETLQARTTVLWEWARLDPDDANRIDSLLETRGRLDGLVLELQGANPETTVTVNIEGRGQTERLPAEPAVDEVFRLGDARDGRIRVEQTLTDERIPASFTDAVSIQIFDPESSLDQEFDYVDLAEPVDGDYYYLRVTQLDGELAWSSPWWVGGERPVAQPLGPDSGDGE